MSEHGWYYLHTNGNLIYKRFCPEGDSDFVRKVWPLDTADRKVAWTILLEGLGLGAILDRVRELANHWLCDLHDLPRALVEINPTPAMKTGLIMFLRDVSGVDPDQWFDWLGKQKGEPDWANMPTRAAAEAAKETP